MIDKSSSGLWPFLSIIIVNFHSEEFLWGCLNSIRESKVDMTYGVYVVDNGSDPDRMRPIQEAFHDVVWIENPENTGYAAANNLVLSETTSTYVLLLNPDIVLDESSIQLMLQCMESHSEVGILGCRLVYPDGIVQQGPFESFPYHPMGVECMEWPSVIGACMMLRGSVVRKCGVMDDRIFLFNEDVELCHRYRLAGWKTGIMPDNRVIHYGGSSYSSLDYTSIERQRALSYLIYCGKCLGGAKGAWKSAKYLGKALSGLIWHTAAYVANREKHQRKQCMYRARLEAFRPYLFRRRRVL